MRLSEIKYQTGYTTDPRFSAAEEPDDDTESDSLDDVPDLVLPSDGADVRVDPRIALDNPSAYGFRIPGTTSSGRWSLSPIQRYCASGDKNCKTLRPHYGVDFNTTGDDAGREIIAPADGIIESAGVQGACGNTIEINHASGKTRYCHLQQFAQGISNGVNVTAGQVIGYVGSTGRSSGPHLHFEAYDVANTNVNPIEWLRNNATYFPLHSVQ